MVRRQNPGIWKARRINKFLTHLDFFSVGIYIYSTDNKQSNSLLLTKMMAHAPRGWGGLLPFIKLVLHDKFSTIHYTIHVGRFLY